MNGLPVFYRNLFKVWSLLDFKRDRTISSLRWLLEEPLINRARFDISRDINHTFHVDVTLDPDTAHPELILSEDGKQVKLGDIRHELPDNPERFDKCVSVLGKEGFSSGRFYFEVQVKTNWDLGVVRGSINRKGMITMSPQDGHWAVFLRNENDYCACADPSVSLCLRVSPQKVGVFVDYEESLVCFYDVDNRSQIYSFTGQTFTEKLFPLLSPGPHHGGKNSGPLIISPVHYNK
ncbi:putative zinc-binding protein A33-like [Triplophysa rosa]|uniref:Zinc-binding protein A33-like n=1 Tax=Triplophysa rosa TaxID=992332 RepID=A0A9W8CCI5_TRIRA|nr:putative zinc-binding protein A33-like [Triplophysa rosa]